jgi:hypothetical protein
MTDPGLILLIGLALVMIVTAGVNKVTAMSKPLSGAQLDRCSGPLE